MLPPPWRPSWCDLVFRAPAAAVAPSIPYPPWPPAPPATCPDHILEKVPTFPPPQPVRTSVQVINDSWFDFPPPSRRHVEGIRLWPSKPQLCPSPPPPTTSLLTDQHPYPLPLLSRLARPGGCDLMEAKLVRFMESMRGRLSCRSSTLGALALPDIVFLWGTRGSCQTRTPRRFGRCSRSPAHPQT